MLPFACVSAAQPWLSVSVQVPTKFVARNGNSELTSLSLINQQVRDLAERMLKIPGARWTCPRRSCMRRGPKKVCRPSALGS